MYHIGLAIKSLREYNNWTQEELAAKTGVSAAAICRLEQGNRNATLNTLGKLATAFAMSPVDLLAYGSRARVTCDKCGGSGFLFAEPEQKGQ